MTDLLRDITIGALCASVVAMWNPPWYLTLIAFWAGVFVGMAGSLIVHLWDRAQE